MRRFTSTRLAGTATLALRNAPALTPTLSQPLLGSLHASRRCTPWAVAKMAPRFPSPSRQIYDWRAVHSPSSSSSVGAKRACTRLPWLSLRATKAVSLNAGHSTSSGVLKRSFNMWSRDQYEYRGLDVVSVLLGINGLVFVGWWMAPPRFMRDNFTCSLRNIQEGRPWTLITAAFSHQDLFHFLFNGMALSVLGKDVMFALGPRRTLALYLAAGLASSLCHLAYVNEIKPRIMAKNPSEYRVYKMMGREHSALGMSGSVMGISVLYAMFFPQSVLLLFGVLPMRAPTLVALYILTDTFFALTAPNSSVSHAGHLGGVAYGLLYALFLRYRFGRR